MSNRKKVDRSQGTSISLQTGLSRVNDQIEKAWILLKERHGENGTDDLAKKFIIWTDMGLGHYPEDIEVKNWYYETSAVLDTTLEKADPLAKRFKKIEKDRTIDDTHYLGPQFSTRESGDILRDGINILEKVVLYLESQIKFLESPRNLSDSSKKYSIFISHINENKEIAEKLKDFFVKIFRDKIDVFISSEPENIPLAQDWFEKIKDGIKDCDLMIILCTPDSVKRPWINFELGAAEILNKEIGPVCFEGQNVSKLPSPLQAIRAQAIDCSDERSIKKHFDKLLEFIGKDTEISIRDSDILKSDFYRMIARPVSYNKLRSYLINTGFNELNIDKEEYSSDVQELVYDSIQKLNPEFLDDMKKLGIINMDGSMTEMGRLFIKKTLGDYFMYNL